MNNLSFTGDSVIKMANNEYKKIENLIVGDYVCSGSIDTKQFSNARVISIIKCKCKNGMADLVTLSNKCKVTPWHPIAKEFIDGAWKFPNHLGIIQNIVCSYTYSIVLENHKHFIVMDNDILAISLGHQLNDDIIKNDKILSHSFYGTYAIIRALEILPNYPYISIDYSMIKRSQNTNLVCDIR